MIHVETVTFRFRNIRTKRTKKVIVPMCAIQHLDKVKYIDIFRKAEIEVSNAELSNNPLLATLDQYLVWTVPGNAPTSKYKEVVRYGDYVIDVKRTVTAKA